MHWVAEDAPVVAVVVPAGHAAQLATEEAPRAALQVPRGHSSKPAAPSAAKAPARVRVQLAEPLGAKEPAAHFSHGAASLAAARGPAEPGGQGRQAAKVWPGAGLYVPGGQGEQLLADVAAGVLEKKPMGQFSQ